MFLLKIRNTYLSNGINSQQSHLQNTNWPGRILHRPEDFCRRPKNRGKARVDGVVCFESVLDVRRRRRLHSGVAVQLAEHDYDRRPSLDRDAADAFGDCCGLGREYRHDRNDLAGRLPGFGRNARGRDEADRAGSHRRERGHVVVPAAFCQSNLQIYSEILENMQSWSPKGDFETFREELNSRSARNERDPARGVM